MEPFLNNETDLLFKAVGELLECDHTILVGVKALQQINGVGLHAWVSGSWLLDFANDSFNGCFGELIWVILHVLFGILVS